MQAIVEIPPLEARLAIELVATILDESECGRSPRAVADRTAAVVQATAPSTRSRSSSMQLRSMADVRGNPRARTVFGVLVAAAACLLLIACANIASLEMAAAAARARIHAIQTALGASRASLLRSGLLEGALLLGASAIVASILTVWGLGILDRQLTTTMRDALTNPLDVDPRVVGFMFGVAALTWKGKNSPISGSPFKLTPRTSSGKIVMARKSSFLPFSMP